jgi:hypothetical protein
MYQYQLCQYNEHVRMYIMVKYFSIDTMNIGYDENVYDVYVK